MNLPNLYLPILRNPSIRVDVSNAIMPNSACVGAHVNSRGQVCASVPVIGSICLPVSTPLPPGASVSACVRTKSHWGIPIGACVDFKVFGATVASKCIGL